MASAAMQGTDQDQPRALLSVAWEGRPPAEDDPVFERASAYAAVLVRTLEGAGYQPRRLEITLRRGSAGALRLHVRGDIPGISETDFVSLARVTLTSPRTRQAFGDSADFEFVAELAATGVETNGIATTTSSTSRAATATTRTASATPAWWAAARTWPVRWAPRTWRTDLPMARILTGLVLGLVLGVIGLPRLDLPLPKLSPPGSAQQQPTAIPEPQSARENTQPTPVRPTVNPPTAVPPTAVPPTAAPSPTRAPSAARVLFAERFVAPLPNWPHSPEANSWFADGAYRLFARDSGRFVAVGVPLAESVGDATLVAQFHKVRGPVGGGYGFIVRDQGVTSERDSRSQSGRYLALEVGDQGDIGVWQREQSRWIDVVPWTHSEAVHSGIEPNTLKVTTRGAALRFEVNGEVVADFTFTALPPAGGVGIIVGGDLNEVALEWLRIETL
jgi:hypothetical protein